MKFLRKGPLHRVAALVLVAPASAGLYFLSLQWNGNFDAVAPRTLYRSAQLTLEQMSRYVERYNIRTVINLRGENLGQSWYNSEVEASKRLGVAHVDFRMSASQELTPERAKELVALMAKAEKPLLIHCKDGADRTGLASALYLAVIEREAPKTAGEQLSFRHGHLSLPFIPEYAIADKRRRAGLIGATDDDRITPT